ncbi:Ricin B lectin [Candidatus Sulfotelmatomonas gaucii]|uniref:Alpha-galactosidase n=1 Tax=Candidatus Sulfuritelmatomonas gaucii TaxID=2043161 RepID=A0A2N9L791_9BACT|nr:Ricin B lectin [Candidatus Sulfotelmatomonas gaucii]
MPFLFGFLLRVRSMRPRALLAGFCWVMGVGAGASFVAPASGAQPLALTPPMGWNDWAHFQCGFTAQAILDNAKLLVSTGLAARGYNTVTIDDCWMQKARDAQGNLQVDPDRFQHGMKPLASAIHALGLKFGIYEDAGSETCGRFAGSGQPDVGGKDHFLEDARIFASWDVDYLKLDGCNVGVAGQSDRVSAYRKAYAAESAALKSVGRPIVFSESAPAYFENTPEWYDVLTWVRQYGQLWREGSDIANYHANNPDAPRFKSVLWNYAYNLALGRFQRPGNWDDPDFIIGGDSGMSLAESRSQMALWSMMSAPLILSSDLGKLSPEALKMLGNPAVIAVDQDSLGRMATLVRRTSSIDILLKPLKGGDYAVAALNRGDAPAQVQIHPAELGFSTDANCSLNGQNLWNGERWPSLSVLQADVASHDTAIWRIHPSASCGAVTRTGAIIITAGRTLGSIDGYTHCLATTGKVEECSGAPEESWTVTSGGTLKSSGACLAVAGGKLVMEKCNDGSMQHWSYTLAGNLVNAADHECLTNVSASETQQPLTMQPCGHNQLNQVWSLPD